MEEEMFIAGLIECLLMVCAGMGLLFLIAIILLGLVMAWDKIKMWARGC